MTQPPAGQPLPSSGRPQPLDGQLPQPGGPGGDYPPALPLVTPAKRGNAFAVAGIVLGILIWPLGLLFSIIGLVKSKARAGSGKVLSIVGIVVSLVGAATSIPFAVTVFRSMAADPGCVIENEFDAMTNKFEADGSAMIHYEGDSSPERAAVQHFIGDAQALRSELNVAAAEAQHQPVRAKIGIMTSDLDVMTSRLQAVLHGDASQISQFSQIGQVFIAFTALTDEVTSLISLCPPTLLSVAHPAACSCRARRPHATGLAARGFRAAPGGQRPKGTIESLRGPAMPGRELFRRPWLRRGAGPGVTSAREGLGVPEGYRARDCLRRRRSRARWLSVVFALNAPSRAWSARDPRPGSKPIWRAKVAPS